MIRKRILVVKGFWKGSKGVLTGEQAKSGEYEAIIPTHDFGDAIIWLKEKEFILKE